MYNGGAWLGDVPTPRLVEIAYFLIQREVLTGIVDKQVASARSKALNQVDAQLLTAGNDEDSGLPSWVVSAGVMPADGSSPFD